MLKRGLCVKSERYLRSLPYAFYIFSQVTNREYRYLKFVYQIGFRLAKILRSRAYFKQDLQLHNT